jgi:hypothetical protein
MLIAAGAENDFFGPQYPLCSSWGDVVEMLFQRYSSFLLQPVVLHLCHAQAKSGNNLSILS